MQVLPHKGRRCISKRKRISIEADILRISSVEIVDADCEVFDIQVDADHSFIVEGCVLHNSDICRSLNASGIDYYDVGKGPIPPLHPGGCRTIVLARTKSSGRSSRKPFISDTRPAGKIPKDERKGKVGITNAPSFDAWLRRQPVATQKEWLGPTRYKLFKNGVKLDKFADPVKGKSFNLAEIEQRNKQDFKRIAA